MSIVGSEQWMYNSGTEFYPHSIDQSLRFNSGDNPYLERTMVTPTNNKKFTISMWIKRADLGGSQMIISAGTSGVSYMQFQTDNTIKVRGSGNLEIETVMKFRDVGSWYHIVFAYDSAQSTDTDRVKLYVNGTEVTDFSPYTKPGLNEAIVLNSAVVHHIGNYSFNENFDFDGYLAEMYLVDGHALTPSTFAETKNDIWVPKDAKDDIIGLTNGFGNNGFYLTFSDSSDVGADSSGQGHNFTDDDNNFTASDVVNDSPTNNIPTLGAQRIITHTLSEGNLKSTNTSGTHGGTTATMNYPTSGKWYHEVTIDATDSSTGNGAAIGNQIDRDSSDWGSYTNLVAYNGNGQKFTENSFQTYGSAQSAGNIIGVAYNADDQELEFYLASSAGQTASSQGTITTSEMDGVLDFNNLCPVAFGRDTTTTFNFGQSAFNGTDGSGTLPTGYKALNTANLPNPAIDPNKNETPDQYFDTTLYTANNGTLTITGLEFQPDFVWIKGRSIDIAHGWFDVLRGTATAGSTNTAIGSNRTDAQGNGNGVLSAFTSDGFTVAGGSSGSNPRNLVNKGTNTYVAWTWKAGGSGVTNNDGTGTSTVSASDESGFSLVKYTGNGSNQTLGHGLSSAPDAIWIKEINSTSGWMCYYSALGEGQFLSLHSTSAKSSSTTAFNNTAPTTSVFSVGGSNATNQSSQDYIAYCFYNLDGYQKIGLYEGNNSTDNAFVFTGFRPRFLMIKNIDSTGNWGMWDTARNTSNVASSIQRADTSDVENTTSTNNDVDILSNGFKVRGNTSVSGDAVTYVYMAIAEQPFKYYNAR
jgi:hypothetical protein